MVLAVTDDHLLAAGLRELGAEVIPDGTVDDLNDTLVQAAAELARHDPELRPVALCADLPALRPAELDSALRAALPTTGWPSSPTPTRGVRRCSRPTGSQASDRPSARAPAPSTSPTGAKEIDLAGIDSVRRDVDTPDDLAAALRLGIGPRTSRLTADLL